MAESREVCTPQEILRFWFEELSPKDWFVPPPGLDDECDRRFRASHLALSRDIGPEWRATPENRLATIILFDQLPRNIYRGSPLAYATDRLALREATLAVAAGADLDMSTDQRAFFYLPFEHSEDLVDQTRSVRLHTDLGDADQLKYAIRHWEVIRQFGRFPHRNAILGRDSTDAEAAFLLLPGSRF